MPASRAGTLTGWGRVPVVVGHERRSEDLARLTLGAPLTRGAGRAYGDAALPASLDTYVAGSTLADRILAFDAHSGVLTAEAGLSLDEIYRVFLPRGFFTPVSPGTRFVTLGGMVASDVHGGNHHRDGTIGRHIVSLDLRVGTGDIVTCSATKEPDLFRATIGGMGLTGHILRVTLTLVRVPSPWIVEERERIDSIDQMIERLSAAGSRWPMTKGWLDGLSSGRRVGRGVLYCGRWAEPHEARRSFPRLTRPIDVPFTCPRWLLTPPAVRAFNGVNFWSHVPRRRRSVIHPERFFYPLDAVGAWHRLYGPRGFIQYQCVLPHEAGPRAAGRFLEAVQRRGGTPFLCVIKDCGEQGIGLLSFPRPGISIALDMPMRPDTPSLVAALNEQVIEAGGRIYLAKDALTRADQFARMEPRLDEFLRIRRVWDPEGRIRSALSMRLFGW